MMNLRSFITLLSVYVTAASCLTIDKSLLPHLESRKTYPFNRIVAYGDELTDNGNGSYAHGITGNPATVYGYGTWTNGPVAVSYLTDLLGVPLTNYAFGGCCGGGSFGATLDNAYTKSPAGAASLVDQIRNYTTSSRGSVPSNIKQSLQFIWVGQNDLSLHTDAFWLGDPNNANFANDISTRTASSVGTLLNAGAPYVFVVGIYPKHIAPVTKRYLCGDNAGCVQTWGQVIQQANTKIQSSLTKFGSKVIYYDVFGFMTNLVNNAAANGFTQSLSNFCDGDGDAMWNTCMVQGHASEFFWMNFVQPSTRVHQMIARDMKSKIDAHF